MDEENKNKKIEETEEQEEKISIDDKRIIPAEISKK